MATDENNHKNEARDDWTGCTFRVERGPSSEGRAWGMADILTDVRRRVWPARPGFSPRRPARAGRTARPPHARPGAGARGHAEDHASPPRAGGAFAEVRRPPAPREPARRAARGPADAVRARARARVPLSRVGSTAPLPSAVRGDRRRTQAKKLPDAQRVRGREHTVHVDAQRTSLGFSDSMYPRAHRTVASGPSCSPA